MPSKQQAPGPLVDAPHLVPPVDVGSKVRIRRVSVDPVPWPVKVLSIPAAIGLLLVPMGELVGPLVFGATAGGYTYWRTRGNCQMLPFVDWTADQQSLAERGEFQTLLKRQEEFLVSTSDDLAVLIGLHDLGYYELRAGNLERALACLSEFYRQLVIQNYAATAVRRNAQGNLAAAYALTGQIEAAEAWLPEQDGRKSTNLGRILTLARAGRYAAVQALRFPRLNRKARQLSGHSERVFRLVQAFSSSKLARGQGPVPESARPASLAEYGYLTANWPELAEFARELEPNPVPLRRRLPKARVIPARSSD